MAEVNYVTPVGMGGTGADNKITALNNFINSLSIGTDVPVDEDYYLSQYVNGNGLNPKNENFYRRPIKKLKEYIKKEAFKGYGIYIESSYYTGNNSSYSTQLSGENGKYLIIVAGVNKWETGVPFGEHDLTVYYVTLGKTTDMPEVILLATTNNKYHTLSVAANGTLTFSTGYNSNKKDRYALHIDILHIRANQDY